MQDCFSWQTQFQDAESSKLKGISLFSGIAALELGLSELIPQEFGTNKILFERGPDETDIKNCDEPVIIFWDPRSAHPAHLQLRTVAVIMRIRLKEILSMV